MSGPNFDFGSLPAAYAATQDTAQLALPPAALEVHTGGLWGQGSARRFRQASTDLHLRPRAVPRSLLAVQALQPHGPGPASACTSHVARSGPATWMRTRRMACWHGARLAHPRSRLPAPALPQAGQTYTFKVTASVADAPFTAAAASVKVVVGPTPLVVTMDGGSARTVSSQDAVTVTVHARMPAVR